MNQLPFLAGFNRWANERLYEVCATVPTDTYHRNSGAFFGSIHNTLNHLLVVDKLWLGRIIDQMPEGINRLDQILFEDFAALREAREAEDERIVRIVAELDEGALQEPVSYTTFDGRTASTPCHVILITVFNHQTHHRGQIHTLITQTGRTVPPLDIIVYANTTNHFAPA